MILGVGTTAFKWLAKRKKIPNDPGISLESYPDKPKKREILTPEEAQKIFKSPWRDNRAYIANIIAMTTGLRASEIAALTIEDIDEDRIHVRHSWSFADGLKTPKNGDSRTVPLLTSVREQISILIESNPYPNPKFIFYGTNPDKPMNIDAFGRNLQEAYIDLKLDKEEQKKQKERKKVKAEMQGKGICFHSWRHFYTTHLKERIAIEDLQIVAGHRTKAMTEHYGNHKQLEKEKQQFDSAAAAVADAFDNIIEFRPKAI